MKSFVAWVLTQRYRLVVLAVALAPLLPVVAAALLTLETVRRGPLQGLFSALLGAVGVVALALVAGASIQALGTVGAVTLFAGVAMGALLRWAGSLALAFQGTVLSCVLAVAAISVFGPDSGALFAPLLDEFVEILRASGASEGQLAAVRGWQPMLLGLLAAAVFSQLAAAMLLGLWWSSLAGSVSGFGEQFRALKLGKVLGVPATVLVGLGLVLDAALVQNLTPLALFGFWFQGLAVLHAWAYARRWHPVVLAAAYVLLVTPLTGVVILGLSSIGLVDNWIDLRAPLRPKT